MKQITVKNPCTTDLNNIVNGYCSSCRKNVVDYTLMSDVQILNSIKENGLGCGIFTKDQLNRELVIPKKKLSFKYFYSMLLTFIWIKPINVISQVSVPIAKIDSTSNSQIEHVPVDRAESDTLSPNINSKIFGTGNVATIKTKPRKSFFRKLFGKW